MRETDKLIGLLAECVRRPNEPLKNAERDVRREVERTAKKHNTTPLLVARELWTTFKERGPARATINRWLCNRTIGPLTPEEFDRRRDVLSKYQKNTRRVLKRLNKEHKNDK